MQFKIKKISYSLISKCKLITFLIDNPLNSEFSGLLAILKIIREINELILQPNMTTRNENSRIYKWMGLSVSLMILDYMFSLILKSISPLINSTIFGVVMIYIALTFPTPDGILLDNVRYYLKKIR